MGGYYSRLALGSVQFHANVFFPCDVELGSTVLLCILKLGGLSDFAFIFLSPWNLGCVSICWSLGIRNAGSCLRIVNICILALLFQLCDLGTTKPCSVLEVSDIQPSWDCCR